MEKWFNVPSDNSLSSAYQTLSKIRNCLQKGCVICIEHSPEMLQNCSLWKTWGSPSCYNGQEHQIYDELDKCCARYPEDFVRLNIADGRSFSKFIFVVQSPHQNTTRSNSTYDIS